MAGSLHGPTFPKAANVVSWIGPKLDTRSVKLDTLANDRFVDEVKTSHLHLVVH